ncbi:MAG: hypothetical protein HC889_07275 [Synechococcaceae cyanobacterium SM1_2_3]|nr:hypothetical protein [Synechococcaceae cyanobacterium SM1_2_3]
MWQDGLALLIVAGAGLWLARDSLSLAFRRFCASGKHPADPLASSGCSGCGSGSSCALAHVKAQTVIIQRCALTAPPFHPIPLERSLP